jgi:hypothetical protein
MNPRGLRASRAGGAALKAGDERCGCKQVAPTFGAFAVKKQRNDEMVGYRKEGRRMSSMTQSGLHFGAVLIRRHIIGFISGYCVAVAEGS